MLSLNNSNAPRNMLKNSNLPVKVLQFGEGNFLRAFIDWMINEMNRQSLFNGSVTVVQPLEYGMVEELNHQDCLYTLLLRGLQDGEKVVKKTLVSSIFRALNVYSQFDLYMKEAENPDLRIIVSNTTEAGIVLRKEDSPTDSPPVSFPGKLLRFMKHRYDFFNGDAAKGFLIFPCELIESNGDKLKSILSELSEVWYPDDTAFHKWLIEENIYFNTLVDRIVSGYPIEEADKLCSEFGYVDKLIDAGEIFHLLVIEGPIEYEPEFPLLKAGFNIKWCDDLTPYRTRKVRILNGAHTMTVLAAHLYGLETVGDCMEESFISRYVSKGIFDEIIPTLDLPENELKEFGNAVIERFKNPFIKHFLLTISLNSVSKYKTRVLPSLIEYYKRKGKLPEILTFSLSALVLFYKGKAIQENSLSAERDLDGNEYEVNDSPEILNWFFECWKRIETGNKEECNSIMKAVLGKKDFWGMDLNDIKGLREKSSEYLYSMIYDGVPEVIKRPVDQNRL